MHVQSLYDWSAKRSGGRITIYHAHGKVPHVDKIYPTVDGKVIAVDKDSRLYELTPHGVREAS